ncbi:hypothetical protein HJFPF1_12161 [Paramyrothecium foliicola]|nr:hypothetical protein HJFPF1_12161 [Paramyrothecium foliicola]
MESVQLSPSSFLYPPLSGTVPDTDKNGPRVVILTTWAFALDTHIAKYVTKYRELFPDATIIVAKCFLRHFFWLPGARKDLTAAADAIRGIVDAEGESSTQRQKTQVLLHLFSNTGLSTAYQLNNVYQAEDKSSQLFPRHVTMFDSSPGRYEYWSLASALLHGIPPGRWLQSLILIPLAHFLSGSLWIWCRVLKGEDWVAKWAQAANDPAREQEVCRSYVYSSADPLVESSTVEAHAIDAQDTHDWAKTLENPLNWPPWKKNVQLAMLCIASLLSSIATSIISPSIFQIMQEFDVSRSAAILLVSLYVIAMGFGPVIGGPVSETIGRHPVYLASLPLGGLFTLGTGFTHTFAGLCVLRFLAGMCWGPVLAVAPATIHETWPPETRGPASALFILTAFLGPGLGPIIGAFVTNRKGWRWNMWTLLFFTAATMIITCFSGETFGPELQRRSAKKRGQSVPPRPPMSEQLRHFAVVALVRPLHMLFFDTIIAFVCLYIAVGFGILFSFFAIVPYVFISLYQFNTEQCGLVFLSVIIGCILGLLCILFCDVFFYRKQIPRYAPRHVPPEHRLYPAMFGSIGLPIGLFWFAWTARDDISWASPAAAIIPFAFGNLCIFVGSVQYLTDIYDGSVVASAASANSLARYTFAAAFPLFIVQMYEKLTIGWAASFFGFFLVTTCISVVSSFSGLCAARIVLGLCESGVLAGIMYTLSSFYRCHELTTRMGYLNAIVALSGAFGGLLATGFTRVPAFATASFLTEEEKLYACSRLVDESKALASEKMNKTIFKRALFHIPTQTTALALICATCSMGSLQLFSPTLLRNMGYSGQEAQLMSVPPYVFGAIICVTIATLSDRFRCRGFFFMAILAPCIFIGFTLNQFASSVAARYFGLFLAVAGAFTASPLLLSWSVDNNSGPAVKAVAAAYSIGFGGCGQLLSTWTYRAAEAPEYVTGHSINMGAAVVLLIAAATHTWYALAENKKRMAGMRDNRLRDDPEGLGHSHPLFRFTP